MMCRCAAIVAMILMLLPQRVSGQTEAARPVRSFDEVCRAIASSGPELVEGVWRLTAPDSDGVLIAIERDAPGDYAMTIVEAPDRSLVPGTLIGRATRGAERGIYDAWVASSSPLSIIPGMKRKKFTLKLSDDGNRLVFRKHRSPIAVNLYMSVPWLFVRPSIRNERFVESTPQGAERVFPVPIPPIEPVYL